MLLPSALLSRFRPHTVAILTGVLLLTTVAGSPVQTVQAAPTYADGNCWQPGAPYWCRTTWRPGNILPIHVVDNFSDVRPQWGPALDFAINTWNSVPGPQRVSRQRAANDSWIFFEDSQTYVDQLQPSQLGLTWGCDNNNYCTPGFESMLVRYNSIKLNKSELDLLPIGYNASTQAHEFGHAIGLDHSLDPNQLMYNEVYEYKSATIDDTGTLPPCSGTTNDSKGLRCIYNWNG